MRIKIFLFIIIFYVFSFIFCQNQINVNNFYIKPSSNPVIVFDPSYNTSFILNSYNPNLFKDFNILDIKLNGSSFSPVGTYLGNYNFIPLIHDSLLSTAFQHNKGDYNYHENIILIKNEYHNNLSSFLMLQGRKHEGLQSINSDSDILQNYLFNINKIYSKTENHKLHGSFSSSLMYHKDNIIIPTKIGEYSRSSDAYMYGITADVYYSDFINFKIQHSNQLISGNHYFSLDLDEHIDWFDFRTKFIFNNHFFLEYSSNRKINSLDTDIFYSRTFLNEDFLLAQIKIKNITFDLGMKSHYSNIFNSVNLLNANLSFYIQNLNLLFSLKKESSAFLNRLYANHAEASEAVVPPINTDIIDLFSIKIDYKNKFLSFLIEPFYLFNYHYDEMAVDDLEINNEIKGLNLLIGFNNDYFLGNINSGLYSANENTPIDFYSNYSILFAPRLNNKRFRPFIGISGIYMVLNNSSYVDFTYSLSSEQNIFPFLNTSFNNQGQFYSESANLLNIQLGFILKNFKVSYHWVNPFNDYILFSFDQDYQPIAPFSKLQVEWQFLD